MGSFARHMIGLILGIALSAAGCSKHVNFNENEREALTAFQAFNQEMRNCSRLVAGVEQTNCDKQKIWEALDAQTRTQYVEAYASLLAMDRIIESYFDPIEHQNMRAKTGTDILKDVPINRYQALFFYLFKPEKVFFDEFVDSGLEIVEAKSIDPNNVHFLTHANQSVLMVRESDGVWRNASLRNVVAREIEPIFASEIALREYASGNLEAEIKRRTKVRDYVIVQAEVRKKLGVLTRQ